MFTDLTFAENTELYMKMWHAFVALDKIAGMLIGLQAWDAAGTVNAMSHEAVGLLEDLNVSARRMRTIAVAPQRCLNCGAREGEDCLVWCAYKPAGRPMVSAS